MKDWIDYYEMLQVHPKAGKDVIKVAYRKLTTLNHPDVCKKPFSEEKMKKINLAYEVLMDERRRKIFHEDWLEKTKARKDKESHESLNRRKKPTKEDLDALKCLYLYFGFLERKDFGSAYKYITPYEKNFIRERDFVEWQEAVVQIIEISSIEIKEFKKHKNFESRPGRCHLNAYEFEVSLMEKNNITSKISRNSFTKIVLKEENEYCVLVGYDNLRPVINKFNAMVEIKEKKDTVSRFQEFEAKYDASSGLLNKKGFMEEAKKEEIRFKRYGRIFSIMFIDCNYSETMAKKEELSGFVMGMIKRNIRKLDVLAKWGGEAFVLLLPETEMMDAERTAEKLRQLFLNKEICVGQQVLRVRLETGVSEYNRHSLMETIYKAQVEKKSGKSQVEKAKNAI